MLTMGEVCERLSLSEGPIRMRIKEGRLHPIKVRRKKGKPRLLFHPKEIEDELERVRQLVSKQPGLLQPFTKFDKLRTKNSEEEPSEKRPRKNSHNYHIEDGEKAAAAATLFRAGKTQIDLVIEMAIPFQTAEFFWEAYKKAQPSWLLPHRQLAQLRHMLSWSEDPPTPGGLMRAIQAYIERQIVDRSGGEPGEPLTESEQAALAAIDMPESAESSK